MSDIVPTSIKESAKGINEERHSVYRAVIPAATSSDDLRITLPANRRAKGFTVLHAQLVKYGAGAAGARTKTHVAITSMSYIETTGVVTIRPAAALDGAGANEAWLLIADTLT